MTQKIESLQTRVTFLGADTAHFRAVTTARRPSRLRTPGRRFGT